MEEIQEGNEEETGDIRKREKLTEAEKWSVVAYSNYFRDERSKKFQYCGQNLVLEKFGIAKSTLQSILKEYDDQFALDPSKISLKPRFRGSTSGLTDEIRAAIIDIHNLCLIEEKEVSDDEFHQMFLENFDFDISKSTLQDYMKLMGLQVRRAYLKPLLTYNHRLMRLQFIDSKIEHRGHGNYAFRNELNEIHIDEKWFYTVKLKRRFRLLPEDDPIIPPKVHHKSHIPKVMFLTAIARPRDVMLPDGTVHHFDGKLGIWTFGEYQPAQRNSINRARGTPVFKDVAVTAASYREMLTKPDGLIATIKQKMFWAKDEPIIVRHDGAKPHTGESNEVFLNQQGTLDDWNIQFERQPAQSPDFNWNDLSFFASLQKRANVLKGKHRDVPSLINAVKTAYNEYDECIFTRIHALQLQIYREVMNCDGNNTYKLPHTGIRKRQRDGVEVADYIVPPELYHLSRASAVGLAERNDQD